MKTALQHLLSLITALIVVINLSFWMIPLIILGLLKYIVRQKDIRHFLTVLTELCYRGAVFVHNVWMFSVVGVDMQVEGELPDHPAPIIISNHQTWMDIPVLHGVVTGDGGPIIKFLVKRELLWVPIIGWICYALGFPALNRGQGANAREKDFAAIQAFSKSLTTERGGLLIFAEGTRFTAEKHRNQKSTYTHLLTPRPGGLKIALATTPPGTPVVDLTIVYQGDTHFWRCLGGRTRVIKIVVRNYDSAEIGDVRKWLVQRWREKDAFFD